MKYKSLAQLHEQYNRLWQLNKGRHDQQVNRAFTHVQAQMCAYWKVKEIQPGYYAQPDYHNVFWGDIPKAKYISL